MQLDQLKLHQIKLKNKLQSILLLALMSVFVGLLTLWLFGESIAVIVMCVIVALTFYNPGFSPKLIMRAYNAQLISYHQAPDLYEINQQLTQRAELSNTPKLYYIPIGTMNAFATGTQENAVIALSDGLLRELNLQELSGVLAHEISHIKHNDMHVMFLADTLGILTRTLSIMGQLIFILCIPAMLLGIVSINYLAVLIIMLAPVISALIQLSLSRNREYLADLSAAQLMGSPTPLINALNKLDKQNSYWERFYRASSDNSLLQTHPGTNDRIEQLNSLYKPEVWEPIVVKGVAHNNLISATRIMPGRTGRYFWF
jgi:heat shock protein HtpX